MSRSFRQPGAIPAPGFGQFDKFPLDPRAFRAKSLLFVKFRLDEQIVARAQIRQILIDALQRHKVAHNTCQVLIRNRGGRPGSREAEIEAVSSPQVFRVLTEPLAG